MIGNPKKVDLLLGKPYVFHFLTWHMRSKSIRDATVKPETALDAAATRSSVYKLMGGMYVCMYVGRCMYI